MSTEIQQLMARMDRHDAKLDQLSVSVNRLSAKVAVLADRDDRAMESKNTLLKYAAIIGGLVSAVVSALVTSFREGS
jgi:methyl-accepting chemotaxis protein|tara:strand:+ start:10 stop:240 length:231 start_codon:yes stop_codon:yes gene_type:complete